MLELRKLLPLALLGSLVTVGVAEEEKGDKDKKKDKIKPYEDVITDEAQTDRGLFLVHRIDDKVYYEIPPAAFDEDMLWVTQLAKTQSGHSYGGMPVGNRVVRWELRGDKVLLRDVDYRIRAEGDDSIRHAVEATNLATILHATDVLAWGRDKAPVIEVSELFTGDLSVFSAKDSLDATGADSKRSFVDEVKSFPENIEVKALMTYKIKKKDDVPSWQQDVADSVTVQLHHSMVKLPEDPMRPRREDERVGYFSLSFEDYADDSNHETETVSYIKRWRLEKADPEAEVSDPLEPIVYYVGREVPEKWRPWVHKGVLAWQPAFEAAGFSNAIVPKDAPSPQEDPDWDPEDARYSCIRWLPSKVENAFGPHVADPRTGEILESDIRMYHNVLKLVRDWYFVQAAASDERAQKLPMPDELVGELLAYVVAHEVGHTLGFPHNMKASSSYTVEQLRDPEFTKQFGTEASIMDYGRFNYVAQPGDGAALIPVVAPYDYFATEWGYRQFPEAKTWEDEKEELDKIAARQLTDRKLLFGGRNPGEDPSQQTEDLGSDSIAATALGLANIDRIAGFLVEATCSENEDYGLLENMYGELMSQRDRELMHVANVVGGFVRDNFYYGDADKRYHATAPGRQREAVAFLNEHAFQTPTKLLDPDITLRLQADGAADRLLAGQGRILRSLVSEDRVDRMAEHAARERNAYQPVDMLKDLTNGIWSELAKGRVEIDLYRRNLQRAHVDLLIDRMGEEVKTSDLPALARGELQRILEAIEAVEGKPGDPTSTLHLDDLEARIQEVLDPRAERELLQAIEANARR